MHQRINKHRIINLDSNQIKKPKLSTNSAQQGFDDKLGNTWLDKTSKDSENKMTQDKSYEPNKISNKTQTT